jgi:molecular chaperone HtpG
LQNNALISKMRDAITSKLLGDFKKRAEKDAEDYKSFWNNFGAAIKEGLCEATAPRDKLLEICRFYSTHGEEMTSLDAYKTRMREGQEAIYYLVGDSLAALRNSPQIEGFKKRGIEVLLLTDHVDDFWTNVTTKYGDVALRSAIRAGEDLQKFPVSDEEAAKEAPPAEGLEALMHAMRELYGEQVRDVRTTAKLAESPVCLAVGEGEMEMRMERFLAEHNQIAFRMPKILEINPQHPLIGSLATQHSAGTNVDDALWLLLDQARIAEGEPLPDANAFLKRLNALMANA